MTQLSDDTIVSALKLANIGFYRYLFDGTIVSIDQTTFDFFELEDIFQDPQSLVGQKIDSLITYTGSKGRLRSEIKEKGEVAGLEYGFKTLKGKEKWGVHNSYFLVDEEAGKEAVQVCFYDITDRKQAEKALKKSENLLANIIDQSPFSTWISDTKGTNVRQNAACRKLFGIDSDDQTVGKYNLFKDPLIKAQGHLKEIEKVFKEGNTAKFTIDYEFSLVDHVDVPHATHTTLDVTVFPIKDAEGRVVNAVVQHEDITERKHAENELLLYRDHLKRINIIQQIFLTCTDDTMYVKVLDFLLESMSCQFGYFGYINEQGDLVCPSMTRKVWDKCQMSNKNIVFPKSHWAGLWGKSLLEKRAIFKNGSLDLPVGHVPLMNALAVPVVFQDKLIGQLALADKQVGFTETDKDYLERIAAQISPVLYARLEQDRHDRKTKEAEFFLRKAKEEWEHTFDAMSDIITIQDKDMHIVRANKAAHEFFQVQYGELNGKHCYEIFTGVSAPCPGCPLVETLQNGKEHSAIITHEDLGKIFQVSSAVVPAENGEISYIVHVAKDITEQKKMEEELFQAHKMEAMGTLAGGIAHDFNNILSAILGYSEFAQQKLPVDSKARQDIAQVISSSQRAAELVKQILTFSRKADQQQHTLQPYLIIKEALNMLRSTLPTTIAIEDHVDPECGSVLADPTNIHQIVVNLCTNAYHAMENEKGTLTVTLSPTEIRKGDSIESDVSPGPFIELSIQDTGQGMDMKTMARIFEPYFTTKDVGKGSGLGLAVIHGIVKTLHGFIRVESELGKGSTFHVYIPALKEVAITSVETAKKNIPSGTERILVVDDENIIVSLYTAILERLGYTVTATTSSVEALEKVLTQGDEFDLVVTDQTMPNLSGVEMAQEILKIKPNLPIILCSGYSSVISEEGALALGIKKYAMKPVDRTTLAQIVRQVLDDNRE